MRGQGKGVQALFLSGWTAEKAGRKPSIPEVEVEVSRHLKRSGWPGDGSLNLRCRGGVHPVHALFAPNHRTCSSNSNSGGRLLLIEYTIPQSYIKSGWTGWTG